MPLVSVVLATYNRPNYLRKAIETVLAQTLDDWELIVVGDGSPKEIKEVVTAYRARDARIHYLWQPNAGCGAARNTGLARARGKYIAFLDDDDLWLPHKLKTQLTFMESHPEIGFCFGRFQIYRFAEGQAVPTKCFPEFLATRFEDLPDVFIAPSTVLLRKASLNQVGGFDPHCRPSEDFDLWLRFAQRWKIAPIDEILTTTLMDGRDHDGKDPIAVSKVTTRILKNLKLLPSYRHCRPLIRRQVALRQYWSGRHYLDRRDYVQAARHFALAVLTDPFVGLSVRRPGEEGLKLLFRILKSYGAAPASLLKGLLDVRR